MKIHITLKALSRSQAYKENLRIYVRMSVFGTLKADNMEILLSVKCSHQKVIVRLAMI